MREKDLLNRSFAWMENDIARENSETKRRLIKTVITLMDSFLSTPVFRFPPFQPKEMRNRFSQQDYVRQENIFEEKFPPRSRSRFKLFSCTPATFHNTTIIEPSRTGKLPWLLKTTNVHHVDKLAYNEVAKQISG